MGYSFNEIVALLIKKVINFVLLKIYDYTGIATLNLLWKF